MQDIQDLANLIGKWSGPSRLWLDPTQTPQECSSTAEGVAVARGKFLRLDYSWEYSGKPQEGSMLLGCEKQAGKATAIWVDSFHNNDKAMSCEGPLSAGPCDVKGSYAAPPGPDWGWRIVVEPLSGDAFRLLMFNITPDGQEARAVEADYRRLA